MRRLAMVWLAAALSAGFAMPAAAHDVMRVELAGEAFGVPHDGVRVATRPGAEGDGDEVTALSLCLDRANAETLGRLTLAAVGEPMTVTVAAERVIAVVREPILGGCLEVQLPRGTAAEITERLAANGVERVD